MIRRTCFCFTALLVCCSFAVADEGAEILQQVREHITSSDYSKEQVAAAIAVLDSDEDLPYREVVSSVLASINKEFAAALSSYDDGETKSAIERLKPLTESEDGFVKTESSYLLAQCLIENGDHESALPFLEVSEETLHGGDSLFLQGICQANLLKREEAIESFAEFMRSHPNASERQRIAAWRQLELLALVKEGTLVDAYQKMEYSRRRLALARANQPTQTRQKETLAILDKLIEEAEEREAVSESESEKESDAKKKSDSQSKGKGKGKQGAGEGVDDKTPMKTVRQVQEGAEATPWDHVRDKKRDAKALAAIKEKYPARYRALIEQYYRSLQEETNR